MTRNRKIANQAKKMDAKRKELARGILEHRLDQAGFSENFKIKSLTIDDENESVDAVVEIYVTSLDLELAERDGIS